MTPRRQLLKIKVLTFENPIYFFATKPSLGTVRSKGRKNQGLHLTLSIYTGLMSNRRLQEAVQKFIVRDYSVSTRYTEYILNSGLCQGSSFATGLEVQDKRKRVLIISTGSKSVDGILGGE